jgi:hypothetical protein
VLLGTSREKTPSLLRVEATSAGRGSGPNGVAAHAGSTADAGWVLESARAVEDRIRAGTSGMPWERGWWATGRTRYGLRETPRGFEIRSVQVLSATRRVALAKGTGRPILVLPGIYASLGESLFAEIAEGVRDATRRPVLLLEDRFAPRTLALSGGEMVDVEKLGMEAAAVAAALGPHPDVLALSLGTNVAFAAGDVWHRVVAWSAAPDLEAVARRLERSCIARLYYAHAHRRAYRVAGLVPPPMSLFYEHLASRGGRSEPSGPTLLVHAVDDPIAPLSPVAFLARPPDVHVCVLPVGGHLGFGAIGGASVYWLPFEPRPIPLPVEW